LLGVGRGPVINQQNVWEGQGFKFLAFFNLF
jgi:hypothetical protein